MIAELEVPSLEALLEVIEAHKKYDPLDEPLLLSQDAKELLEQHPLRPLLLEGSDESSYLCAHISI